MKVYSYSQARQNFSSLLDNALKEEVCIKRRSGEVFTIVPQKVKSSPFDIPSIKTDVTINDILSAVKESRGE